MKKIFIMAHSLEIGGAERALLGLLENIDTNKYIVDLFLLRQDGELMPYIPNKINLLPRNDRYASLGVPILGVIKEGNFSIAIGRLCGKNKAKKRIAELKLPADNNVYLEYSHKYTVNVLPDIGIEEYDLAISFLTPHYIVAQKVKAKKKLAWIHTDYATLAVDRESELKMWDAYEYIASISEQVTVNFLKIFPELKEKTRLIPNIMPMKCMKAQAQEFLVSDEMPRRNGEFRLLSIGRFCTAKNFDNVPTICRAILKQGVNVKWYLIGYGGDEPLIRQKIQENGMQDYVIILGKKENPYPYIEACDIYVQPSRYEGKSVSVVEAQILHKPVVITAYSTSSSQLINGYDGIIVPMDNEQCANGIVELLKDLKKQEQLIENTMQSDYSNVQAMQKLYDIIEEK